MNRLFIPPPFFFPSPAPGRGIGEESKIRADWDESRYLDWDGVCFGGNRVMCAVEIFMRAPIAARAYFKAPLTLLEINRRIVMVGIQFFVEVLSSIGLETHFSLPSITIGLLYM